MPPTLHMLSFGSRLIRRESLNACRGVMCTMNARDSGSSMLLDAATSSSTFSSSLHYLHSLNLSQARSFHTNDISRRTFSSRQAARMEEEVLVNEQLISNLVRRSDTSADGIQVRLIMERSANGSKTSEVVSLSEAIKTSIDEQLDLIGVDLKQEIPVVKVDSLKRLQYQKSRKTSSSKTHKTQVKEIRFKATIAENDLQRKVDNMVDHLSKGNNCLVTIKCSSSDMAKDPKAARNMAQRVIERVTDYGEIMNEVRIYAEDTMASFSLRPSTRKKSRAKEAEDE